MGRAAEPLTMLVMFILGLASLPWMLVLGAVMAVEKNTTAGRRLRVPVGVALLAAALAVAAVGLLPRDDHGRHRHTHSQAVSLARAELARALLG